MSVFRRKTRLPDGQVVESAVYSYEFEYEGRRYKGSTRRTKQREALAVVESLRKQIMDRQQLGNLEEWTLGNTLELYLENVSKKQADYEQQKGRARKLFGEKINPYTLKTEKREFGLDPTMSLHELSTRHVSALREARVREGLKPNTIDREVALLQAAWNWARVDKEIRVKPQVVFRKDNPEGKLNWLKPEEVDRLLKELDPQRPLKGQGAWQRVMMQDQYDLVVFLLDTGARYAEVSSLTWDVVDLKAGTVNLYRHKVGNESTLTMTDRLKEILERRYAKLKGTPYIFPGRRRGAHRGYATGGIRKAIARAGLNDPIRVARFGRTTPHTFRDTFASWLAIKGMSLYKIGKLLGHASVTQTKKYSHLCPDTLGREAATLLNTPVQVFA